MALITAAEYVARYKVVTGTGEDTLWNSLIAGADGLMAASCGFPLPDSGGHTLEDVTYTLKYDGPAWDDSRVIDLGVKPVLSITTAHSDPNLDYGAETLIAAGDLDLDIPRGRLWLRPNASSSWSTGPRSNKIVMVAGFATVPAALKELCFKAVRHLHDADRAGSVLTMTQGGQTMSRGDADSILPRSVVEGLGPYRVWGAYAG